MLKRNFGSAALTACGWRLSAIGLGNSGFAIAAWIKNGLVSKHTLNIMPQWLAADSWQLIADS
jgi:hypothetical protein